jgi:hypothetical protein
MNIFERDKLPLVANVEQVQTRIYLVDHLFTDNFYRIALRG